MAVLLVLSVAFIRRVKCPPSTLLYWVGPVLVAESLTEKSGETQFISIV